MINKYAYKKPLRSILDALDITNDADFGAEVRNILAEWENEKAENRRIGVLKVIEKSNCKPVSIDGVDYYSINEALRKTGRSYSYIRKRIKRVAK